MLALLSSGPRDLFFLSLLYIHTLCMPAKVLMSLRGCAGSSETLLLPDVIRTKLQYAGPMKKVNKQCLLDIPPHSKSQRKNLSSYSSNQRL